MFFRSLLLTLAALAILSMGCEKTPPPEFRFNSVEWLRQERTQLSEGEHFDEKYKKQVGDALTALYGTPNVPHFPPMDSEGEPTSEVINLDNLKMAAGAVSSERLGEPHGLYREHCAHCHGVTGDGAGPTASSLNPYPRDFRLGKFKFKSTPLRKTPTNEDLTRILRNGVPGTAMPSFQTLDDQEIEALVDYVKYLTMRGVTERLLIAEVGALDGDDLLDVQLIRGPDATNAVEVDSSETTKTSFRITPEPSNQADDDESSDDSDGDSSVETASADSQESNASKKKEKYVPSEDDLEAFEEQLAYVFEDIFSDSVYSRWIDPADSVTEVPPAPVAFDPTHDDYPELLARGRELFYGTGNCLSCHGETGLGDGQTNNYDDWTNDWINTPGVKPVADKTPAYRDFIEVGAMRPRTIRPRNLRMPVYRGGGHADDIFRRITNGIEGTPMPTAIMPPEDIWAIVAFVKSLPFEKDPQPMPSKSVNDRNPG